MIRYVTGDATRPQGDGPKIIVHCCNNVGAWGAGFVIALSKRWREPERAYRTLANRGPLTLGAVDFVAVENEITVANLIGQSGLAYYQGRPPIRYNAIEAGLDLIADRCRMTGESLHIPRMGAGLAGGDWNRIETIIEFHVLSLGIPVTVYDLPSSGGGL